MSAGSSASGSRRSLCLASVSGNTIGGSVSLIGGRGGSDIGGGVATSLGSRSSTDSGSVTMLSADTDSGGNDGNADDVAASDDIDDGDDIGEDNAPNTYPSHHHTTITIHGGGPQTRKETRVTTEQFFRDSADIVIFNIPIKEENDSYNNDDVDNAYSARIFTIIQHRLTYTFTTRFLVIALTLALVIICNIDSLERFNTDSLRKSTQPLVITLTLLHISHLLCL